VFLGFLCELLCIYKVNRLVFKVLVPGLQMDPVASADGGGDGPVRKMKRGPAVQPRGEAEKVVGILVWTIWGRSGVSTRRC
jgi:hypothetical protein